MRLGDRCAGEKRSEAGDAIARLVQGSPRGDRSPFSRGSQPQLLAIFTDAAGASLSLGASLIPLVAASPPTRNDIGSRVAPGGLCCLPGAKREKTAEAGDRRTFNDAPTGGRRAERLDERIEFLTVHPRSSLPTSHETQRRLSCPTRLNDESRIPHLHKSCH
jgi:hypothetical protein